MSRFSTLVARLAQLTAPRNGRRRWRDPGALHDSAGSANGRGIHRIVSCRCFCKPSRNFAALLLRESGEIES